MMSLQLEMNPSLAALLLRVFVSYMEKYSHTLQAVRISDIKKNKIPPVSLWFQTLQFVTCRVILQNLYEGVLSYVE